MFAWGTHVDEIVKESSILVPEVSQEIIKQNILANFANLIFSGTHIFAFIVHTAFYTNISAVSKGYCITYV